VQPQLLSCFTAILDLSCLVLGSLLTVIIVSKGPFPYETENYSWSLDELRG
jgi:hypothetical protein